MGYRRSFGNVERPSLLPSTSSATPPVGYAPATEAGMKSLGLRVEATTVHWAIVEGTPEDPTLVESGRLRFPKNRTTHEQLSWLRTEICALVAQFGATSGGIRLPEPNMRQGLSTMAPRLRAEGVVLEAMAASNLSPVVAGPLSTIGSLIQSKQPKGYLSEDEMRGMDWSELDPNKREAAIVACAALAPR